MNAPARYLAPASLTSRWLITKIITAVALSLIVLLGAIVGGHHEGEQTPSLGVVAASSAVALSHASEPIASTPVSDALPAMDAVDEALLGSVGCLLGVFCCILLFALARWVLTRRSSRHLSSAPRSTAPILSTGLAAPTPLTLEQLSLSRT